MRLLFLTAIVLAPFSLYSQLNEGLEKEFEQKLQELADAYNLKGVAASIIFQDGSIWNGVTGKHGDIGDLSTDMLFEMGSITKTFTAAMILQMAEEGTLTLNDSIGKFLDPLEHIDMGVTIKQLLGHTSGIYSYSNHKDFSASVNVDINVIWQPEEILDTFMKPMTFVPGAKWEYSNTNFLLLGLIIEAVDGNEFEESLRKRLLDPLELEHSYLDIFESYNEPRSGTWLRNGVYFNEPFPALMSAAWAAGGLVSTTEDLALWAHTLYNNEVLSESWTDSMKTPLVIKGKSTSYGLALFYKKYRGYDIMGHAGATLQHSLMEHIPDLGVTVVTVTNEQDRALALDRVQQGLFDLLIEKPWGLGTLENKSSENDIYPNPSTGLVFIDGAESYEMVNVYSVSGQKVFSEKSSQNLNLSTLEKGTYIVELVPNKRSTSVIVRKRLSLN